ncbi:DUF6794 domain-containing protein [Allorhodopirellula solitaria]|uniref:DUF6794 domain-containing protein n=1 Tax=Allorhodopirellula solitaria TaxID=2527987 RepID=A0A5C5YE93_9BACT|nr:DUF6794 domain-containing protein [Allorhodopirellula solitaria]TWT73298.1 hypothetical protein CA85_17660 [Allorhodopirellula solitaria]
MAKKKASAGHSKRLDPTRHGIHLSAILEEIKPHLDGMTQAEIGKHADLKPMVISHLMTGYRDPSLGAVAALADAAGGRLVVKFEPPAKPKASKPKTAKGENIVNIDPNNTPRTVDDAARQLLDSLTDAERAVFRESEPHELHLGIGLEIRNAWRLHDHDTPIRRDAMASKGFSDSGYDPLDGDAVSNMIIATAQEMGCREAGVDN